MIIAITGVAGVGKTTIGKKLSEILNFEYINLTEFAIKNNLIEEYDEAYQSYIVDEEKVIKALQEYIKNNSNKSFIIEGNFSHLIDADLYIVIKTDPNILLKRLEERGYPYHKIFENLWAMNLEVIEDELESFRKNYYVFYNNDEKDIEEIIKKILEILKRNI